MNAFRVYRGIAEGWPCMGKWSFDYFRSLLGNRTVEVMHNRNFDPRFEPNMDSHKARMFMTTFLDICEHQEGNNTYVVANNNFWKDFAPFLQADIRFPLPRAMFWMGPKGTNTPLHRDPVDVVHVQIVGSKRWRIIDPADEALLYVRNGIHSDVDLENPDYARFPLLRQTVWDEVICKPGDGVVVPKGWFHQVSSLEPSISIGFAT